ncbi:MAG: hypothetical protein AAF483_26600 [Planctomycetota bacterium]
MFSFGSKKVVDAAPVLRRIVDLTIPNAPTADETRSERRFNRTLPLVLTPTKKYTPQLSESVMGVTQDISDRGLGALSLEELPEGEYTVSLWPPGEQFEEPIHLLCMLVNCRPIAHGFWANGFCIQELLNLTYKAKLEKLDEIVSLALRPKELEEVGT